MSDKLSTQDTVLAGQIGVDLNSFKTDTTPNAFEACRAIYVNVAGTYKLYFVGAPTTAITMILPAGTFLDCSLVKIVSSADGLVAAGAITVIY